MFEGISAYNYIKDHLWIQVNNLNKLKRYIHNAYGESYLINGTPLEMLSELDI